MLGDFLRSATDLIEFLEPCKLMSFVSLKRALRLNYDAAYHQLLRP